MPKQLKKSTTKRIPWFWYVGGILVIAAIAFGLYYGLAGSHPQPNENTHGGLSPANGQVVDGIPCEASESLLFHIHPTLSIMVEGQERTVPADIGILQKCLYWVHTHDATGMIHVESPVQRDYTLGNFFDIWGQPLDSKRFLDRAIDSGHSVLAYVDGQRYLGDPRQIVLKDLEKIELMYGPPFPPLAMDQ
jgi:hypothetical protein